MHIRLLHAVECHLNNEYDDVMVSVTGLSDGAPGKWDLLQGAIPLKYYRPLSELQIATFGCR